MPADDNDAADKPDSTQRRHRSARRIASDALLGGINLLLIEHRGGTYRLQETRNGKLILTK